MESLIFIRLTWLLPSSSDCHITPSDGEARVHFQVGLPITNVMTRNCLCCFALIMHLLVSWFNDMHYLQSEKEALM